MKLRDLIDALEELADDGVNDDAEVRLMSQPDWPFEYSISGVVQRQDFGKDDDEVEEVQLNTGCDLSDVFLVEGTQLGYGDKRAWEVR